MYFLSKNGDIPASYVSLREGSRKLLLMFFWGVQKNLQTFEKHTHTLTKDMLTFEIPGFCVDFGLQ